jgi:hypothetical protein
MASLADFMHVDTVIPEPDTWAKVNHEEIRFQQVLDSNNTRESAQVTKKRIVDEIFARITNPDLFSGLERLAKDLADYFIHIQYPDCLAKEAIGKLICQWAQTSSKGMLAEAIQLAARDTFALDQADVSRFTGASTNPFYSHHGATIGEVLKLMKAHTADYFRKIGVTQLIALCRGINFPKSENVVANGVVVRHALQPLSSFTIDPDVAKLFAHDYADPNRTDAKRGDQPIYLPDRN